MPVIVSRLLLVARRPLRGLALGLLLPLAVFAAATAQAQTSPTESEVKAAFVYNFLRFAEWPATVSPRDTITVCVSGGEALTAALSTIEGRQVHGKPIVLKRNARPDDVSACHALVTTDGDVLRSAELLRATRNLPVLTIGDAAGFAAAGGCIELVIADKRVQFEVNVDAVNRAGLRLSSQLLRLDRRLRERTEGKS